MASHFLLILGVFVSSAHAESILLQPELISPQTQLEQTIANAASYASADLTGNGYQIYLSYSSPASIETYILFLGRNGAFDPLDALHVTLPEGSEQSVTIPLSTSPAWSPGERTYRLYFLTNTLDVPSFHSVDFKEPSATTLMTVGLSQLIQKAPYSPSSYHQIRSHRVFGMSLTLVAGITLLIVFTLLLWRKKPETALGFIITVLLFSQLRFSADALRYTANHIHWWEIDSIYQISNAAKEDGAESVYVCSDGSSYLPTIMRYALYPIAIGANPTHVVVLRSHTFEIDGSALRCNGEVFNVAQVAQYSDDSILYRIK